MLDKSKFQQSSALPAHFPTFPTDKFVYEAVRDLGYVQVHAQL